MKDLFNKYPVCMTIVTVVIVAAICTLFITNPKMVGSILAALVLIVAAPFIL